jgi:hypothetical protein
VDGSIPSTANSLQSVTLLSTFLITVCSHFLQNGTQREASKAVKYLGIWLDSELTFDTHREKAIAKAGTSLEALR